MSIITGPLYGAKGVNSLGFTQTEDSYFMLYILTFGLPDYVPSVNLSKVFGAGERCPDPDQVFVAMTNRGEEKSAQRLKCAAIVPPNILIDECVNVTLGEEPRPSLRVNTTNWLNWISCPSGMYMTELYWTEDPNAPIAPYRYSAARCCAVHRL